MEEKELEEVRGKEIAMIFQDPMTSLNPVLTLELQLTEALKKHHGMTEEQAKDRAVEMMDRVGIPDAARRLKAYPHQFSGGMRQRVMIAMMVACNPTLLIADEPTTALDVTIQAQIVELAIRMREQVGLAMFWITHDLGVVAGMADRVIVMYAGTVVEEAEVDSLYEDPLHPYTHALLGALPRVDQRRDRRLNSIPAPRRTCWSSPRAVPLPPAASMPLSAAGPSDPRWIIWQCATRLPAGWMSRQESHDEGRNDCASNEWHHDLRGMETGGRNWSR